jgi:hypothetical protein
MEISSLGAEQLQLVDSIAEAFGGAMMSEAMGEAARFGAELDKVSQRRKEMEAELNSR